MKSFPDFMTTAANAISSASQSPGVTGWVYEGGDGKQMTYWICAEDGASQEHTHAFDEYFVVVEGEFTIIINDKATVLHKGDEYHIAAHTPHSGVFKAGTRTIHCFGGKRANLASDEASMPHSPYET